MTRESEYLFIKLEEDGETAVRVQLAQGIYGQQKIPLIVEWLQQKERARDSHLANKNLKILKCSMGAAWAAAFAAAISALSAIYVIFKD